MSAANCPPASDPSNIGLAEVNGQPVTVEVTVTPPDSKLLAKIEVSLGGIGSIPRPAESAADAGTFGQFISAVTPNDAIALGTVAPAGAATAATFPVELAQVLAGAVMVAVGGTFTVTETGAELAVQPEPFVIVTA